MNFIEVFVSPRSLQGAAFAPIPCHSVPQFLPDHSGPATPSSLVDPMASRQRENAACQCSYRTENFVEGRHIAIF
jgi:hypothetical protein